MLSRDLAEVEQVDFEAEDTGFRGPNERDWGYRGWERLGTIGSKVRDEDTQVAKIFLTHL